MERKKAFDLKQSNFTYLFLIGSFLTISLGSWVLIFLSQDVITNYSVEITLAIQLVAYIPLIVYAFNSGTDIKSVLRIKAPSLKQAVLTVVLAVLGYIIATMFSAVWNVLMQLLGVSLQEPESTKLIFEKPVWLAILILCVYAPAFEEFIFRGMILSGYSAAMSPVKAAVVTGVLFGMTHGYIVSVAPTALIGVFLALIVIYTGSIFTGLIYHALNNLIAYTMVMDNYFFDLPWKLNLVPSADTEAGAALKLLWIALWGVVAIILAVFVLRALKKNYVPIVKEKIVPQDNRHRLLLIFGIAAAFIYVALTSVVMNLKLPGIS
jgi:membrane protease YdiL (CAAX protease family)